MPSLSPPPSPHVPAQGPASTGEQGGVDDAAAGRVEWRSNGTPGSIRSRRASDMQGDVAHDADRGEDEVEGGTGQPDRPGGDSPGSALANADRRRDQSSAGPGSVLARRLAYGETVAARAAARR